MQAAARARLNAREPCCIPRRVGSIGTTTHLKMDLPPVSQFKHGLVANQRSNAVGSLTDCVLQHLAVENQHDMDAMLATLDGEHSVRDEAAGRCYEGKKEVADRYAALWKAFPDFNVFPRRLIEGPNCVVMLADYSGTHLGPYATLYLGEFAPTGKKFNVRLVNIIDFNGDKISRETIFIDVASQLKQLGLL
jgi:steroid delta-isomerase-like uncharacterized protein